MTAKSHGGSVSRSPSAIVPDIRVTVEFQRGKSAALVSSDQIRCGVAWISIAAAHSMRNVRDVWVTLAGEVVISADNGRAGRNDAVAVQISNCAESQADLPRSFASRSRTARQSTGSGSPGMRSR